MTSIPNDTAAISLPRTAKKARPVLELRRLVAANQAPSTAASRTNHRSFLFERSKWVMVRGWPIEVALQGGRVSDVELAREVHDRGARYVPRVD